VWPGNGSLETLWSRGSTPFGHTRRDVAREKETRQKENARLFWQDERQMKVTASEGFGVERLPQQRLLF
jgi:hypothetical protein